MPTEEEIKKEIKKAFLEYIKEHELPKKTHKFYTRQFLPERQIINYSQVK